MGAGLLAFTGDNLMGLQVRDVLLTEPGNDTTAVESIVNRLSSLPSGMDAYTVPAFPGSSSAPPQGEEMVVHCPEGELLNSFQASQHT